MKFRKAREKIIAFYIVGTMCISVGVFKDIKPSEMEMKDMALEICRRSLKAVGAID